MNPTEAQIGRLWRWCGFTVKVTPSVNHQGVEYWQWLDPSGVEVEGDPPFLTLVALFKYAVPKLRQQYHALEVSLLFGSPADLNIDCRIRYKNFLTHEWALLATDESADPALALFWAINSIIEKEKGE